MYLLLFLGRPTEFLPVEYTSIRGVEAKMYKEQEGLSKKSHLQIEEAYINRCAELKTYGAVFFPARVSGVWRSVEIVCV